MKSKDLLGKPAPSFDEPIEMLEACPERIVAQCRTLEKLMEHLPQHVADTQAQQAVAWQNVVQGDLWTSGAGSENGSRGNACSSTKKKPWRNQRGSRSSRLPTRSR
ncbi:hypothetical protein AB4Y35_39710 [Paraburkholderia sp. EG286A]